MPKRAVFILGEPEYESHLTMPAIAEGFSGSAASPPAPSPEWRGGTARPCVVRAPLSVQERGQGVRQCTQARPLAFSTAPSGAA